MLTKLTACSRLAHTCLSRAPGGVRVLGTPVLCKQRLPFLTHALPHTCQRSRPEKATDTEERSPISLDSPQRAGSQLLTGYLPVPAGAPPSDGKEVTLSHARLLQNRAQRTSLERSSTRGFLLIWSADIFPFERIDPTFSEDVF